jgi:hypothetical protein
MRESVNSPPTHRLIIANLKKSMPVGCAVTITRYYWINRRELRAVCAGGLVARD